MKKILIDTNIYSHAMKGAPDVVDILQKVREIGICTITIGELLSGFKGGNQEKKNREELEEFLDAPRVSVYHVDELTAEYYAEILNQLKKKGKPIPTNDIWISAVTFQHGLKLYSKDQHFQHIPGIIQIS